MSDFSYQNLTPDLILDAIESIGIYPESGLLPLNSYENRVYQFRSDDTKRYVAKFYRPNRWLDAQIKEEHAFSFELANAEVPVVCPLKRDAESLFEYQGYRFALFPSVGGRQFEMDNLDQLEVLGRYVGRLHSVAKQYNFAHRPSVDTYSYLVQASEDILASECLPTSLQLAFSTVLEQVVKKTKEKFRVNDTIRLHGDCHAGNILWSQEQLMIVDLDDCRQGPAIQDLWMMLNGDRQNQALQLDTLLGGYEEFSELDMSQLQLIEPLRAMRMVHYMGWLAKRWEDPAFPRNFSWFATDKYWEQQILALKEQLAALDEPALSIYP
ncbi:stress response serine/threonine protein kinase YihE [Pseudoalteromonas luteoviolacea]|uniref:Stress response kinase A n=1 Tax=Pseudoalteromonas luteoviolacea TaxID=43657 RepID=A0A1C0TLI1_9GAMM|nr:serine/threonine protein kinase [Pseudoalteromonas luteoviolacea]OCQ19587.1 stress response serine/threonine protein kinase YihE [Pseudoalteromonas luteoviolacea]